MPIVSQPSLTSRLSEERQVPIPVVTPLRSWPSRVEAERECLAILRDSGYSAGDRVTDLGHVDVLTGLALIHPHATEKIGPGIEYFSVGLMVGTPGQAVSADTIGFKIHQFGGKSVDFSYIEAIYPSDQKRRVTSALRSEVDDLRLAYRDSRFAGGSATSDVSGSTFARRQDASVIYENPSFSQLAYRFAESEGGWNSVDVESGASTSFVGDALVEPDVRQRWRDFYQAHARPQLATRSEGARRVRVDEQGWAP